MKNLKCKVLALFMGASVFMCGKAFSQVPSYVPANGLVGWWPFNGNANDESGNGNNGTVNGATLTADRNGVANKAYSFDGVDDFITTNNITTNNTNWSVSFWYSSMNNTSFQIQNILGLGTDTDGFGGSGFSISGGIAIGQCPIFNNFPNKMLLTDASNECGNTLFSESYFNNIWYNVHIVFSNGTYLVYINSLSSSNGILNNVILDQLLFGSRDLLDFQFFKGKIDDIGIWNRALTAQEINTLYNGCGNEITSQPTNFVNTIGSNAQFSVNGVAGSTYQWQSNPLSLGWQNISNNSIYNGSTTNTLSVFNTTISNHNQPFRAIVNAGGCVDTSDVAQIIIGDTCLTTVTDTLIINTTLGLPAPNNENTILIYPNPASDHITIDNGNYTAMAGYTIKIENNAGQQVFQSLINQAQFYVDLSTWSGNGLYFVHLIDAQGNTVTVRKIVLQ
jgi:hypothetical protein